MKKTKKMEEKRMKKRMMFIISTLAVICCIISCSKNSTEPTDSETIEWCDVPAGDYTWGEDDEIQNIAYDYQVMKYEVTNQKYANYVTEAYANGDITVTSSSVVGYYPGDQFTSAGNLNFYSLGTPSSYNYARISFYEGEFYINEPSGYNDGDFDNHPVVYVTWFGAWAFAQHYGLRLPTEQEWEKAARGLTGYEYPWGNYISGDRANYWSSGDPWDNGTTPVGYYNGQNGTIDSPSPCGVYDMCGNVFDWTDSWYNSNSRVVRGGYWSLHSSHNYLRSWCRENRNPAYRYSDIGFRCARTP